MYLVDESEKKIIFDMEYYVGKLSDLFHLIMGDGVGQAYSIHTYNVNINLKPTEVLCANSIVSIRERDSVNGCMRVYVCVRWLGTSGRGLFL